MALQMVMQITFLMLPLIYGVAGVVQPGPHCEDHCGNVSIPFPFGIGPDCYLDEGFAIDCNNGSGDSPRAIISNLKLEVLEINLTSIYENGGTVRVKSPIIDTNCWNMTTNRVVDLRGSPFHFSYSPNIFTAVGCNNLATMTVERGTARSVIDTAIVGCVSNCSTSCSQPAIPYNLQIFNVSFKSQTEQQGAGDGCKMAFLVEQEWFDSTNITDSSSIQNTTHVPVLLSWQIYNNWTQIYNSARNRRNVNCNLGDSAVLGNYTYCECADGYKGNPYLSAGCEDIDECQDEKLNKCERKGDCVNREGSYTCDKQKSRMKMVAVGISTSLGVLILLIVTWWLYNVIKKRNEIKLKKKFFKKNGGLLLQQQLSSSEGSIQSIKQFNSDELEKATDHFNESRILGQGGQGTVYKGMLVDGRIVAIKKSKVVDEANLEQFANEIVILSQVNHRNVVKLLGCCLETEVPLLVYEFIPNGTLFHYLHDQNEEFPLTWNVRLRIATEVARALSYLHSATALPIYHRDIKSTNILLDDKYKAKLADFGTSRSINIDQTHLTTVVQGTFGYLDPEYFQTSQFTEKSDVYSFRVVLVELLTGEKPVSSTRSQESRSLAIYFILSIEENHLFDILDDQVKNEGKKEDIMIVANLAKRCLYLNGKKRPTMKEITTELEEIQKVSNVQQNYEELEYARTEEIEPWDVSTSMRSGLESGMASSSSKRPTTTIL